jgi:hypothetical protein
MWVTMTMCTASPKVQDQTVCAITDQAQIEIETELLKALQAE